MGDRYGIGWVGYLLWLAQSLTRIFSVLFRVDGVGRNPDSDSPIWHMTSTNYFTTRTIEMIS